MLLTLRTFARWLGAACAAVSLAVLAGCGAANVDSGGLTAGDLSAAQSALDALQGSNIPLQLLSISQADENLPARCRVHLVSGNPSTFEVYVFWVPYLGGESYTWLNMTITKVASNDRFHLGTAQPVLPGGVLTPNGRAIEPGTADTTLLSLYGAQQRRKNHEVILAHAGNVFSKPGANCQVLMNGDLRILPNR